MSDFVFTCHECGDSVVPVARVGRTRELVRNIHLPIPDNFKILTCLGCGEEFSEPETTEWLDRYLFFRYVAPMSEIFDDSDLEWFKTFFNKMDL